MSFGFKKLSVHIPVSVSLPELVMLRAHLKTANVLPYVCQNTSSNVTSVFCAFSGITPPKKALLHAGGGSGLCAAGNPADEGRDGAGGHPAHEGQGCGAVLFPACPEACPEAHQAPHAAAPRRAVGVFHHRCGGPVYVHQQLQHCKLSSAIRGWKV